MKTYKTLFAALVCIFYLSIAGAQTQSSMVWKTYEDFKNQKQIQTEGNSFTWMNNGSIKYKSGGEKFNYKPEEYWGFTFRGDLMRAVNVGRHHVAAVVAAGNFVYYTVNVSNGGTGSAGYSVDEHFVSKDLNSPSYRFWDKKSLLALTTQHPELKELGTLLNGKSNDAVEALKTIIQSSKEYKTTQQLVPALKATK